MYVPNPTHPVHAHARALMTHPIAASVHVVSSTQASQLGAQPLVTKARSQACLHSLRWVVQDSVLSHSVRGCDDMIPTLVG